MFISFSSNHDLSYFAFQTVEWAVIICHTESKETEKLTFRNKKVLGYHWIDTECFCDFFVVTEKSIEFFRFKNSKLSSAKSHSHDISHYWFDQPTGLILTALGPSKLGEILIYNSKQRKKQKKFLVGKFKIDTAPAVNNHWTTSLRPVHNVCLLYTSDAADE